MGSAGQSIGSSHSATYSSILQSWDAALQQMNHEDLELNDGLPSTLSALLSGEILHNSDSNEPVGKTPKSKGKGRVTKTPQKPIVDEDWSPPGPDPLLEIPGEHVLAREKRSKTIYWPARVLSYVPPTRSSEQPKYRMQYLDNSEFVITRDMFFTSEEDEFATCKVCLSPKIFIHLSVDLN